MMKVAIIGTTSWGTTLGVMLARRGIDVALWARTKEEAEGLARDGENNARLPGIPFPKGLFPTSAIEEALQGASLVILAVPSQEMRRNVRLMKGHIAEGVPILSASKGLETGSAKRMTQVIAEELDPEHRSKICVLSGPNLSKEIARGLLAATVIAAHDDKVAERVSEIMHSPSFQVYPSEDVVGVELGGALKNIIALGAGMVDGLGYGDNAKAAYMARGLTEIAGLGAALGADPITFLGLAGLGDLLATCASTLSRNHTLGEGLAKGRSIEEVMASLGSTVEGVPTTAAALKLARELGVAMPITEQIYRVLFEGFDPAQAMAELIGGSKSRHS
ncbi:MAG: NAD(P)-dependent glycerol-3-phosphate dehydrogenase [Dehalococcoidia bacterium]|nr:MAG: NAD(P)-dependent glycerol-3-phosphate dehydrogenase [Dehalococcoidia bacterium]